MYKKGIIGVLLKDMPHEKGAEIGVWQGKTSKFLLKNLPNLKTLYCVDPWLDYPEYDNWPGYRIGLPHDYDKAYDMYCENIAPHKDRVKTMRMFSADGAELIEDESLDFVFIDGNHNYEFAKQDILLWSAKVKKGGLVSGDDYGTFHVHGVKKAVKELFPKFNLAPNKIIWWIIKNK